MSNNTMETMKVRITQLENILDSIHYGFFTLDTDFNFTYINKAFEEICGHSRDTMMGVNYWDQFPLAKDLKFWPEYHTAFKKQKARQFEEYATAMGKWVSVSVYPSPRGLSIYFIDVTEQRNARLTIEMQNKQLLEIAQIQSHKVRKPVASILGLAPLLACDNPCDPSNAEVIRGIIDSCEELDNTIKEIEGKTHIAISSK